MMLGDDACPCCQLPAASAHAACDGAEDPSRGIRYDLCTRAAEPPRGWILTTTAASNLTRALPGLDHELVDLASVSVCISPHRVVSATLPLLQLGQLESDGLVVQHALIGRDPGLVVVSMLLPKLHALRCDSVGRADPDLQKVHVVQAPRAGLHCGQRVGGGLAHATGDGAEGLGSGVGHHPHSRAAKASGGRVHTAAAASGLPRDLPGLDRELVDL